MKKIIFLMAIGLVIQTSCTGLKTTSIGLDNEAYLEFVGTQSNYFGGVDVNLDDKLNFIAEVNKDHADRPKGKVYSVSTGKHILTVTYKNIVLYKKQIFVTSQETIKKKLP